MFGPVSQSRPSWLRYTTETRLNLSVSSSACSMGARLGLFGFIWLFTGNQDGPVSTLNAGKPHWLCNKKPGPTGRSRLAPFGPSAKQSSKPAKRWDEKGDSSENLWCDGALTPPLKTLQIHTNHTGSHTFHSLHFTEDRESAARRLTLLSSEKHKPIIHLSEPKQKPPKEKRKEKRRLNQAQLPALRL